MEAGDLFLSSKKKTLFDCLLCFLHRVCARFLIPLFLSLSKLRCTKKGVQRRGGEGGLIHFTAVLFFGGV
jgi:hypothetical protein